MHPASSPAPPLFLPARRPRTSCQPARPTVLLPLLLCVILAAFAPAARAADEALAAATTHLDKGRYAEALEAFQALAADSDTVPVARGLARCQVETGEWTAARKTLESAITRHPRSARLRADLAMLLLDIGQFDQAETAIDAALQRDAEDPLARFAQARLLTETGQLKQAGDAWRWFVRYYNRVQPTAAEDLLLAGRGSLQYARWNSVSPIFGFVLNTICTDVLKDNPDAWQALHLSGELLLEKHNRGEALPEFRKALAINPQAAEVHASLARAALEQQELEDTERSADRALEIHPNHLPALHVKADLAVAAGQIPAALKLLQQALGVNPHSQETLARLAAASLLVNEHPAEQQEALLAHIEDIASYTGSREGRFAEITIEVASRNPHPGAYLARIGSVLESRRQYFMAEQFYRAAMRVMPQLAEPQTALGLLYMRVGRTEEAREILDKAFKADPYHVRVSNMRKVLRVLSTYDRITTDHFVIHVDGERDRILGEYMAEYLEEIYPELVRQFGFEPPGRTHFEIYARAKGLSGHQWFSARMIGLPWIQTIGASTGVIVALTSPAESKKPFNWARVLRHEFVHVITLQQTRFHIPHWFTEALAVRAEGYPRPEEWNRLLLERVPRGDLRTLENLSEGFTSPSSSDDWQFAYCQSRLYADYMTQLAGDDCLSRLLDEYRHNRPTAQAIATVFGITLEEFETGYRKYLDQLVAELATGRESAGSTLSLRDARTAYEQNPEQASAAGHFARALLAAGDRAQAREIAVAALERDAAQPEAGLVLAQLELRAGNRPAARQRLEAAFDAKQPHLEVLVALGALSLDEGRNSRAAEVFEIGRKSFPWQTTIARGLATACRKLGETSQLEQALTALSRLDADDAGVRRELAELAASDNRPEDVIRHARGALEIDVLDVKTHVLLGHAWSQTEQPRRAVREFEVATRLDDARLDLKVLLAEALLAAEEPDRARTVLDEILKRQPDHRRAAELRESLTADGSP